MVLARVAVQPLWTADAWARWIENSQTADGKVHKTDLPLEASRREEKVMVGRAVLRRPAAAVFKRPAHTKRTPLTRKRDSSLILGGVMPTIRKRRG